MNPSFRSNHAFASGSAGVSPAVFRLWSKTFCREHGDLLGRIAARQKQSAGYLFSVVATRTNGARRLRRFRLAQTRDVAEFPEPRKVQTVKRPEGRAPAALVAGLLNTYSAGRRLLRPGRSRSRFSTTWLGLLIALATSYFPLLAQTAEKPKRNLLFVGQAKGYQHETISTAMVTLYNLGRSSGLWNTQLRTDCAAVTKKPLKWEAKNLNAFDAIVFFTDGDLDMDASQKADLLSFVRDDGKGFIGIHSAAITFTGWPEYGQMLGGYFDGHPWGQFSAPLVVEDATFPGMNNFPATFTLFDEVYQIKDFSRQNVRVLLTLDADKIDLARKGVKRTDKDFAVMWARNYGKGRVLYNGLGHVQAVWERPDFQKMWLETVQWSMGLIPGDATPRSQPQK